MATSSESDASILRAVGGISNQTIEIGDLLVAYLKQLEIDYVFGIPGGAIEPLYNALARSERQGDGPRAIVARHETGAAFMASGYSANSKKLGVCCSTTGPGATNLITGVASAYENNIPLLVITAQTAISNFGKGALQESSCTGINTIGMFHHCTKYNTLISHIDQFERKLCSAIISAIQNNCPAHISIPLDIMRSLTDVSEPSYNLSELLHSTAWIDTEAVNDLYKTITTSKNIVFVIGDGCSEGIGIILDTALLLNAKIVTTPHGKGLVSPYHPLFRGVIGFAGHDSATQTLSDKEVDIVLAIGTSLGEWASNGWDVNTLMNDKLIHIEEAQGHFVRSPMARLHVRGRISSIFDEITKKLFKLKKYNVKNNDENYLKVKFIRDENNQPVRQFALENEAKYNDQSIPIKPQRLMYDLPNLFPPYTCYLADPGNSLTWAVHYLHPFDRRLAGQRDAKGGIFQASMEFASMGWAIGASIGTALARPNAPIVCITGDGSLLMAGQEITVALQEQLTVIFIVLNDSALGMVKHGQRLANAEKTGFELPEIDYSKFAQSMGITGHIIKSSKDFEALDIESICKKKGPTLLDVRIDPEEVPPMATRMKVLGTTQ